MKSPFLPNGPLPVESPLSHMSSSSFISQGSGSSIPSTVHSVPALVHSLAPSSLPSVLSETQATVFATPTGNISSLPVLDISHLLVALDSLDLNLNLPSSNSDLNNIPTKLSLSNSDHVSVPINSVQPETPPTQTHTMVTRSMNNIFKPKQIHTVTKHPIPPTLEPTCVSQVVLNPQWREAMSSELTALMRHGTWDLVPRPKTVIQWAVSGSFG